MIPRPQTFAAKLLLLFVVVVAAAQFATWFIVSRANRAEARAQIAGDLRQAGAAFANAVKARNELLVFGAITAGSDFAVRPLFVEPIDRDTLASALESIRLRINADFVTAVSLDSAPIASTAAESLPADVLTALIARADADPSPTPTATGYGYLYRELYSVVVAPVRAPDIVAWLVLGFRIDAPLARTLKDQTGVDVSFADSAGRILATTLDDRTAAALATVLPSLRESEPIDVTLAGHAALVSGRQLPVGPGRPATLALQFSLDEKLAPALATERLMLGVACGSLLLAGLVSVGFARRLGRPIEQLAEHTKVIAAGNYAQRINLPRRDELGRLATAFNAMSAGLAERDRVRDLLDKNVSPEVAAQLLREGAALGGEEREVTILFSDLRGFTTLSEQLPPPELLTLLNRYLDRMSAEIERHGGVIDKFIGDAVMALFGAPLSHADNADRALAAALAMERALVQLNAELAAEGRAPLAIGIGINTARVVAGNIGSHRRLNYSVIGDGVNVAARLQALTRTPEYQTSLIVSAATLAALRDPRRVATRPLGPVNVKGRAGAVEVFAVSEIAPP